MAPETAILLHFDEPADAVLPSDKAGGLLDLTGDTAASPDVTVPAVVPSFLGVGREFDTDVGLKGVEDTEHQTRLRRDMTIEVLCKPDLASWSNGDYGTLIQRGSGGSAAERILWGMQLQKLSDTSVRLLAKWQEADGTDANVAGVSSTINLEGWLYLWLTRRWVSATEVLVRYGVGDVYLGEETVGEGDIGNGDAGTTFVGCRRDGTGTDYEDFFLGIIDSIRVTKGQRSLEELRQVYRQLAVHGPAGYAAVRAHVPARVYSQDPDSIVQRELQTEGGALGLAMASQEDRIVGGLPDAAWEQLDRWEQVCRLPSPEHETYETRRARVLAFLRSGRDFAHDTIKAALAEPLDLSAELLQILEGQNLYTDDFATAAADFWQQLAYEGNGVFSIVSGKQRIAGSGSLQWLPAEAALQRQPIDREEVYEADPAAGADITIQIPAESLVDKSAGGLAFWTACRTAAIWAGVVNDGGTKKAAYRVFADEAWGTLNVIDTVANLGGLPLWFSIKFNGGTSYTVFVSGDDELDRSNDTAVADGPEDPVWCGLVLFSTEDGLAALSCDFDDWRAWFPLSHVPFNWFVFRDPAEDGTPDMEGANRVVGRVKPAHTLAAACQTTALACDDEESLVERDPLGG